jgi:two-component system, chemotaxis family, chemotaxis protein CheY
MKILVVDDDAAIRRVIRRVLRAEFGAEVSEAEDGMDVLDRLHVESFDLIILDLHMKVINGVETLEAIRRTEAFADLPVVLVTGQVDEDSAQRLRGLKPLGAIVKPFTPALLQERLHRFINQLPRAIAEVQQQDTRLNLQASTRILVAGPDDEHRKALSNLLTGICEVAMFTSTAGALRETLTRPPDVVFFSGTDPLLPPRLFASKVPKGNPRKPRLFLVDSAEAEFPDTTDGAFDGILPSATETRAFLAALRPLLTDPSMALVLLSHRSPAVQAMFETVAARIGTASGAPVTSHRAAGSWSLSDDRAFEAAAEVRLDDVSWVLKVLLTHSCALDYAKRFSGLNLDLVSDEMLVESTKELVTALAMELSMSLMDMGMSPDIRPPQGGSTRRYGSLTRASALRSQSRWLSAGDAGTFAAAVVFSTETAVYHGADAAASV